MPRKKQVVRTQKKVRTTSFFVPEDGKMGIMVSENSHIESGDKTNFQPIIFFSFSVKLGCKWLYFSVKQKISKMFGTIQIIPIFAFRNWFTNLANQSGLPIFGHF
ncbi:MAG: hypothetical protein IKJ46_06430 [Tidjanibacter sp.]|nr:hypothetical protein [Tidjanibacter sp.]